MGALEICEFADGRVCGRPGAHRAGGAHAGPAGARRWPRGPPQPRFGANPANWLAGGYLVESRPDFSVLLSSSTTGHTTLWCDTTAYSGTPKPKAIEGTRSITGWANRPEPLRLNDGVGILGEPHTAGSAPDPPPPGRRAGAGA